LIRRGGFDGSSWRDRLINDAPLAQADVAVAMNTGTSAKKRAW
jgi:hypothetical protein